MNIASFKISKSTWILVVIPLWVLSVVAAAKFFGKLPQVSQIQSQNVQTKTIVEEESAVIDVVDKVSPSVVTVSAQTPSRRILQFSPFGGFSTGEQGGQPQDIGTGFIVSGDGLIVTNKHVVSVADCYFKN